MNGLPATPPLRHPSVTIDGQVLEVKKTLLSEYVLDGLGVNMSNIIPVLAQPGWPVGKTALTFKIFAAFVADHFASRGLPVPTVEHWLTRIELQPDKAQIISQVLSVVYEVVTKELEKNVQKLAEQKEQAPAQEPALQ